MTRKRPLIDMLQWEGLVQGVVVHAHVYDCARFPMTVVFCSAAL